MTGTRMFRFNLPQALSARLADCAKRFTCSIGGRGRARRPPVSVLIHAGAELLIELIKERRIDAVPPAAITTKDVRLIRLRERTRARLKSAEYQLTAPSSLGAMLCEGCRRLVEMIENDLAVIYLPSIAALGAEQDLGDFGQAHSATHPSAVRRAIWRSRRPVTNTEASMMRVHAKRVRPGASVRIDHPTFTGTANGAPGTAGGETFTVASRTGDYCQLVGPGAPSYPVHAWDLEIADA